MKLAEQVVEITRYSYLPRVWRVTFCLATALTLSLAIYYIFGMLTFGLLFKFTHFWLFIGLVSFCAYLILPARKKDRTALPWYDVVAGILILGISIYFSTKGLEMYIQGWNHVPSGFILGLLVLESGRRMGGPIFVGLCAIAFAYPLFAGHMPGMFWGPTFSFDRTIKALIFTQEGMLGVLTNVAAGILVSFIAFAGVLMASGGGAFFLRLASALLGRRRGGPAKVAVMASALFGSLSGSPVANVIATGSFTIPAMKRLGYSREYAGAIEACASTGGILMPPVMGALIFIMCEVTGLDYAVVVVAAFIPAFLYYFALLMQVDAYAARTGLVGLPKEDIPSLKQTLKEGWPFIFVLFFLIWGLIYMRWGYLTPWYAAGLLILLSWSRKETRLTPKKLFDCLSITGRMLTQSAALIFAINFLYGGLLITGVSGSFAAGLVHLGGGNLVLILLVGIMAAYIFGMVGMSIPGYILLSVTLAPALITVGNIEPLAAHLFIAYYVSLSMITPPVAVASFIAAIIAEASRMRTAVRSMILGFVIYFIPMFFLFEPALIAQGQSLRLLYLLPLVVIGITFVAAGFEGYLLTMGKLKHWARPLLIIAGALIAFPTSISWETTAIGAILVAIVLAVIWTRKKVTSEKSANDRSRSD